MTTEPAAQTVAEGADARPPQTFLMCPPTYFSVRYRINPWMHPEQGVDVAAAEAQWQALVETIERLGHRVTLMTPDPGLPDMVFTANGGIAIGADAMAPRFRHAERAPEALHFARALIDLGYARVLQPRYVNEGEGDFRYVGERILGATGFRSDSRAAVEVEVFFGIRVTRLRLVDPRFYHLDTALGVLDDATVAYWPGAFGRRSRALLRRIFPDAVLATEADAAMLGLNLISDGRNVIMPAGCTELPAQLAGRGFTVYEVDMTELRKAGGGPKCCVLHLHTAGAG